MTENGGTWNIASSAIGATDQTPHAHGSYTRSVVSGALSTNGKLALSATGNPDSVISENSVLRVWDTTTAQPVRELTGHRGWVFSCALSDDGRVALAASRYRPRRLMAQAWDTASGRVLGTLRQSIDLAVEVLMGGPGLVALSADGRQAILTNGRFVNIWDIASGRTRRRLHFKGLFKILGHKFLDPAMQLVRALSVNGRLAFTSALEGGTMQVWDIASGKVLRTFEQRTEAMWDYKLSADGRRVLAKCGDRQDPTLRVWDMDDGRMLQTLVEHADAVYDCALNTDGRLALATLSDGTLRLWDTDSGEETARWTHEIGLSVCALSADGRLAMAGDPAGDVHFLELSW